MSSHWDALLAQWKANRRLRLGIGFALLIIVLHFASSLADGVAADADAYRNERALLVRLEDAAADDAWPQRADEAEAALAAIEAQLKDVAGSGEAQAELQTLLSAAATSAGVVQPTIRTERAVAVEGMQGVLEVSGRLAGATSAAAAHALLADLAARPWVRVERIELRDGTPGEVQMIVRGYFRRTESEAIP